MHICLFDIDGTLILTDGAGQAAFDRTFKEDFNASSWNGKVEFSGRSDRAIVAEIFSIKYLLMSGSDQNLHVFL